MKIVTDGQVENFRDITQKDQNQLITDYVSILWVHTVWPIQYESVQMYFIQYNLCYSKGLR